MRPLLIVVTFAALIVVASLPVGAGRASSAAPLAAVGDALYAPLVLRDCASWPDPTPRGKTPTSTVVAPTATATPTVESTSTATPSTTLTPSSSPTPSVTLTPSPSATPTITPTPSPSPIPGTTTPG